MFGWFSASPRLSAILLSAVTLVGCAAPDGDAASKVPEALALAEDSTTTTLESTSNTTSTTERASTTTTDPTPVLIEPADLAGAESHEAIDLVVRTAPEDELNVRYGPGVQYEIFTTLAHLTDGIASSTEFEIESGAIWRLISFDGEFIGWAHSSYLADPESTSLCSAGDNFPGFDESPLDEIEADLDGDGVPDQARLFVQTSKDGSVHRGWLSVLFANGGHATGHWPGVFQLGAAHSIRTFDLSHENEPRPELLIATTSGATIGQIGVMAVDGCAVSPTTIADVPFAFSSGASVDRSSSGGCFRDAQGRTEFVQTTQNFNTATWEKILYELVGTEWSVVDRFDSTQLPGLDNPEIPTLADCV